MKDIAVPRRIVLLLLTILLPAGLQAQANPMDLSTFIGRVEANSLELEQARTDRSLAEVQEQFARSQLYPTIAGQVGYARNLLDVEQPVAAYADSNSPIGTGLYPIRYTEMDVNADNDLTVGLSLQQKLFDMSVFRGLEASRQYTTLTSSTFEATRQGIITESKRLFFQTLLLQEVLEVRKASEEIARENYLETQKRFESGIASRLEVLRAEVNWKITQPNTTQAERNLLIALQNLKNLAGLPQETKIRLQGSLDSFPELPMFARAEEVQAGRPDFRILMNEKRLRELNISAKRATFFPSLSASVGYGWRASSDEFDFSDPTDTLSVGLTLTVPVFYGGSRFASLRQAKLELQQTETRISKMENDIATELENVRLTLQEAHQRIISAQQTLLTAEEAYNVTETSVESGLATQLELKDARVSLEQARLSYLSAVFDYLSGYFNWQRAVGKGADLVTQ